MSEIKEANTPLLERLTISWSKLPKLTADLFWRIWGNLKDTPKFFKKQLERY